MNPTVAWYTSALGTVCGSWAFRRTLANFACITGILLANCWLFGNDFFRYLVQRLRGDVVFGVHLLDYLPTIIAGVVVITVVTIIRSVFKTYYLSSYVDTPGGMTPEEVISCHEKDTVSKDINVTTDDDGESWYNAGESLIVMPNTQIHDDIYSGGDQTNICAPVDEDRCKSFDFEQQMTTCSHLEDCEGDRRSTGDCQGLKDQILLEMQDSACSASLKLESPVIAEVDAALAVRNVNISTQTDDRQKPMSENIGTMTSNQELVDVSVGSHTLFKIVRSTDTTTSGPFMKKLRRAQRLLKEARVKFKAEHRGRLEHWEVVLSRYREKLEALKQSLDRKDVLLSYTALNRALSENEVKDMCTAVSSARDRLNTQCKLNFALKEVVDSKCDSATPEIQSQATSA